MVTSDKGKKRCEYLPKQDDAGKAQMLDYRDRALVREAVHRH